MLADPAWVHGNRHWRHRRSVLSRGGAEHPFCDTRQSAGSLLATARTKERQVLLRTVTTGPPAILESRTKARPPVTAHSTHSPPAPLLYVDVNHVARSSSPAFAMLIWWIPSEQI